MQCTALHSTGIHSYLIPVVTHIHMFFNFGSVSSGHLIGCFSELKGVHEHKHFGNTDVYY
jgi:hypothetical protein